MTNYDILQKLVTLFIEDMKRSKTQLHTISEEFQRCFGQWETHWNEWVFTQLLINYPKQSNSGLNSEFSFS